MNTLFVQVAQITNPSIGSLGSRVGEGGVGFVGSLLQLIVTVILIVGGLYFFFQIVTGGVAWIGSGGDKGKLEEARQKVLHAGIGIVLLFSAFAFIRLIEGVFGIGILSFTVPTINDPGSSVICTNCTCGGIYCNGACVPGGCIPR